MKHFRLTRQRSDGEQEYTLLAVVIVTTAWLASAALLMKYVVPAIPMLQ